MKFDVGEFNEAFKELIFSKLYIKSSPYLTGNIMYPQQRPTG
jgi:hypothetical protein